MPPPQDRSIDALLAQLADAPAVSVVGVIDPSGCAAVGRGPPGDVRWCFSCTLIRWRVAGLPVRHEPLRVRHIIAENGFAAACDGLEKYGLAAFRVRLAETHGIDPPEALLVERLPGPVHDAELESLAADLQVPVVVKDAYFGPFTLDRRSGGYEAETAWLIDDVTLSIATPEYDSTFPTAALAQARLLWADAKAWNPRILDCMIEELLPLKNGTWLDEDETELSREDFLARVTLSSITMHEDGEFAFWFEDGDLFLGHSIEVAGSLATGPRSAGLQG